MGTGRSCFSDSREELGVDLQDVQEPIDPVQASIQEKALNDNDEPTKEEASSSSAGPDLAEEDLKPDWVLPPGGRLSVMMFGMSGAGKSALGNLIAGSDAFASGDDTASITNLDSIMKYESEDDSLMLLDTIGLGDTEISQEKVVAHIRDVALSAPNGIDVLLLVMRNARITDDTIARITYATEYLWGKDCLLNLYVIITFAAPKYVANREEAHAWIDRQVEINWRFKHIYSLVGDNPNRFIFVDNPDPESMEPGLDERRQASKECIMKTLCLHPKDAVPPWTSSIMEQAQEVLQEENKELQQKKDNLRMARERRKSRKVTVSRLPGRTCRIIGDVEDDPSLKGKDGMLQEWDPSTGKWSMVLQDGRKVKVLMQHLKLLSASAVKKVEAVAAAAPSSEEQKDYEKEVQKALAEKAEAEAAMAKKISQVKNDKVFEEKVVKESQMAASRFTDSVKESKEETQTALPATASSRLVAALKAPFRRTSKGKKEAAPDAAKAVEESKKSPPVKEKQQVKQAEDISHVEVLRKVKEKIQAEWRTTPSEVFKHLGGPTGSTQIMPFSFNMFLQSAEPGISRVAVGQLWRQADVNCDGMLSLQEFEDLLR